MADKEMLVVHEWASEPTFKSLIQSDGQAVRVYTPSVRLFIVGAVHIAQALVPMAQVWDTMWWSLILVRYFWNQNDGPT